MKPLHAWLTFLLCLAALAGAMAFTTTVLMQIDRQRIDAARASAEDDAVRAALWQMDAEVSTLVADEAARPYFEYYPFYPAEAAYTRMFRELERGEVLVPSQLLTIDNALLGLHFQIHPDNSFTSPQAPTGNKRDLAESRYLKPAQIDASTARLEDLRKNLNPEAVRSALPRRRGEGARLPNDLVFADDAWAAQNMQNRGEYEKRAQATKKMAGKRKDESTNSQQEIMAPVENPIVVREHPMTALWFGQRLFLARLVTIDGADFVQGCEINWPGVQQALAASSIDMLPTPTFAPASGPDAAAEHRLASLPVRLSPGEVRLKLDPATEASPVRMALWVAWGAVLMAALAVGLVLRSTVSLSERRADFVSAVTHELRTPLTTLRMYTELLSTGRVKDDTSRGEYLDTMHAEAVRLSHLVENVLSYARLERGRARDRAEQVSMQPLLDRIRGSLLERARQARMELAITIAPDAAGSAVRVDPAAIERILFNLVDNACKYAAAANDKRIELTVARSNGKLAIRVRDFGPGIDAETAARLFKPFRKSAQAAANSAPGVGLGLSLCRGLARAMNGDLRHVVGIAPGACLELELPAA
ncbi:MAG: HAMP domain-containing histidine kinase [Planctomycetes bacterium]|nr:HAMP domain-containing histidine kinase [Planctomycetota bacterium]